MSGSAEVEKMNVYKVRKIIEWIRTQGKLPKDAYGQVLSVDDLMGWFGLNGCLTGDEQLYIRNELAAMIEAELALEEIKLSVLLP